jgi:hypothetical protein
VGEEGAHEEQGHRGGEHDDGRPERGAAGQEGGEEGERAHDARRGEVRGKLALQREGRELEDEAAARLHRDDAQREEPDGPRGQAQRMHAPVAATREERPGRAEGEDEEDGGGLGAHGRAPARGVFRVALGVGRFRPGRPATGARQRPGGAS